jgi:predicted HicB family RNase H-like nuclease
VATVTARQLATHVDADLHDRVIAEAERRDVSVSQLIGWAVERMLPAWEAQSVDEFARVEP